MNEPHNPAKDPKNHRDDTTRSVPPVSDDATVTTPSSPKRIAQRFRDAQQPTRVGHYKILETLGEGGMGTVYLAEQTEPVHRKIALKLIKLGMDTKQVIARFDSERQALAMMDHPNVAKMFDAGTSEQGRPYFVMEYVPGIPITDYCDKHRLTTKERLTLFMQVCHAIQHAHQKGIIHRDIKPNNVLVSVKDGEPVPKVIDFGVAKATQQKLTEKTLFTEQGQLIGTPEYMSPEQAEMTALDIDTRSDIYSLGVMLYELLAGALPFEPSSLRQAAFGEIQRIIREQEPPKPSTRLSSLGDESGTVAKRRRTTRAALQKQLHGDLDWITMKALEKDRTRRYATATEFAADIARHLGNEPVLASPPSAGYRLRKFVRRNKGTVAAGVTVAAVLVFGLVGTSYGLTKAVRAREGEATQRRMAEKSEREALDARDDSEAVVQFLSDMLAAVSPEEQGKDVSMREVLDEAAKTVGVTFIDKPLIEARLRSVIGISYRGLGLLEAADPHISASAAILRRELGPRHPGTLASMANLGTLLQAQGKFTGAEKTIRRTYEIQRRILGEEHPSTLASMSNLANALRVQGRYAEAEKLDRQTLEIKRRVLGEEHPSTLASMNNLSNAIHGQGRYAEAEKLNRLTLEIQHRVLGEEHPDTLRSMNNLASAFYRQGRYPEAQKLYRQTLEIRRRVLGEEHPDTLGSMNNLANALYGQGRYAEAQKLYRWTLEIWRRVLGEEHPGTLAPMNNLANALRDQGRYAEAEKLYRRTLEIQRRVHGEEHPDNLRSMNNLAITLCAQGRYAAAEKLHRQALDICRRVLGEEHPDTLKSMNALIDVLNAQDSSDEARPLIEEWLAHRRDLAKKPDATSNDLNAYAWALLTIDPTNLRDPKAALPFAQKAVEQSEGKNPGIMDTLALAHQMTGNIDAAVETETKAVALLPPVPSSIRTDLESNLAKFLIEQESYAKAEPLLLSLHLQLADKSQPSAKVKQESIQRLINLYIAWGAAEPGNGYGKKGDEWSAKLTSPEAQVPPDEEK